MVSLCVIERRTRPGSVDQAIRLPRASSWKQHPVCPRGFLNFDQDRWVPSTSGVSGRVFSRGRHHLTGFESTPELLYAERQSCLLTQSHEVCVALVFKFIKEKQS